MVCALIPGVAWGRSRTVHGEGSAFGGRPIFLSLTTWLHVLCGSIVLAAAPLALALRKGSLWHRRAGQVFVVCMVAVASTALVMWQKLNHLFLVYLDIVVVYLFVYGYRVVLRRRRKHPSAGANRVDLAADILVLFGSALTIWVGFAVDTPLMRDLRGVLTVVGGIGLIFGGWDIYSLLTRRLTKTGWMFLHMTAMIGAYISAVTAFIVINAHSVPMILRWMVPISVGSVTIVSFQMYWRLRLTPVRTQPGSLYGWFSKLFWDHPLSERERDGRGDAQPARAARQPLA